MGLSDRSIEKDYLSELNEDVRKVRKVTFSEADYAPPIYNVDSGSTKFVGPHGASMKKPRQRNDRAQGPTLRKHFLKVSKVRRATRSANALVSVAVVCTTSKNNFDEFP